MSPTPSHGRVRGRPPAGARAGERVRDYPQLSVRLPPDVRAKLYVLSVMGTRPQWRVLIDAIECLWSTQSEAERAKTERLLAKVLARQRSK
jgi:hypothetical protein